MKDLIRLGISINILMLCMFSCGDKTECENWWFKNNTEHNISVESYCQEILNPKTSFALQPYETYETGTCGMGYAPFYFAQSPCIIDSVLLIYNDTLVFNTKGYWDLDPTNPEKYTYDKKNKANIYNFTEAHYQKALEVNGY
jgi:hypothetical protein